MTLVLGIALLILPDVAGAESAYRAGRFAEALALYAAALSEPGVPEGPVLFNMGNCAWRLGRPAEAVLHYRRAQLRLPRDAELRFNLRLAQERLGPDAAPDGAAGPGGLAFLDLLTPVELLVAVVVLESAGLIGLVLLRRRRAARWAMAAVVAVALAGAVRLVQLRWFAGPPEAVVLAEEVSLRPEPHADVAATHRLRAGAVVRIEEMSDRWIRVVHPRGAGWTERAGVGLID